MSVISIGLSACIPAQAAPDAPASTPTAASSVERFEQTATVSAEAVPLRVWVGEEVPPALARSVELGAGAVWASSSAEADVRLGLAESGAEGPEAQWVYVLAAPFPTVDDEVSAAALRSAWLGKSVLGGHALRMSAATSAALEGLWGQAGAEAVEILPEGELLAAAWRKQPGWAVIPFEALSPRWKALRVGGQSPLDGDFSAENYALTVPYRWTGEIPAELSWDKTNREAGRMTSLVLTGTTALARQVALRMEEKGVDYPGLKIGDWLRDADIAHVSNEVPFDSNCPPAVPLRREMRFCSDPKYIELLSGLGVDVVELTGNHLMDWGPEAMLETMDIYEAHGLPSYGGGRNLEEAQAVYEVEHNGNRLAFLGCNVMGPEVDWATETTPGSAPCDLDALEAQVRALAQAGKLPIVTFQHFELDDFRPQSAQRIDFQRMAAAGAVIVSGSQAHHAQTMTFVGDSLVHYGLGNLFFDQMTKANRPAFMDRHIFYDGRYVGTELMTMILEDGAQPRPMTAEERKVFLGKVFNAAVWPKVTP